MTLLASLCAAALVYLAVGSIFGVQLRWQSRRRTGPNVRSRVQRWLEQSDTAVSLQAFGSVVTGSALVAISLVWALTGVAVLGGIAGCAGGLVPVVVVEQRRAAITRDRRAAWPDALRDIATRLRSGASMHAALVDLARLGPEPLRPAFRRYERLANALDHRMALETVRAELAEPLADRIIEVLLVAFDQGGRVVIDILDDLAESAVADLRLMADIDTAQLETTIEARGAAVLPFVVLGLLCLGSPGYRAFYASAAGTVVVVLGLVMSLAGVVLISRLGRTAAEPRTVPHGGGS